MDIDINVDLSDVIGDIDSLVDDIYEACQEAVKTSCFKVEADAKKNAPVDTG